MKNVMIYTGTYISQIVQNINGTRLSFILNHMTTAIAARWLDIFVEKLLFEEDGENETAAVTMIQVVQNFY